MAAQKKILDIDEGSARLVCLRQTDPKEYNPYLIYVVISATGAPIRRRLLAKRADFPSVLSFVRDFYLEGINTLCYTDMVAWSVSHSS